MRPAFDVGDTNGGGDEETDDPRARQSFPDKSLLRGDQWLPKQGCGGRGADISFNNAMQQCNNSFSILGPIPRANNGHQQRTERGDSTHCPPARSTHYPYRQWAENRIYPSGELLVFQKNKVATLWDVVGRICKSRVFKSAKLCRNPVRWPPDRQIANFGAFRVGSSKEEGE